MAKNSKKIKNLAALFILLSILIGCGDPIPMPPPGDRFTSIAAFEKWLSDQPGNTYATPYKVALNVNDLTGDNNTPGSLGYVLTKNFKFMSIDLSGSTITTIPDEAFVRCSNLISVTMPNSVTTIGDSAFLGCDNLSSVTIPNSVTTIGDSAFFYCLSLTSVTIPDSVTSNIGYRAFCKCYSLTSVTIGNSVTSIGDSAFENCESLTSVTIPNNVTSIGQWAFGGCSSLTSVTFQDGDGSLLFYYNSFLGDLVDKGVSEGYGTYTTTAPVTGDSRWTKK